MSVLNENQLLGASGAGGDYEIEQSLRFDDGGWLSHTPSVAGNRKTWTFSCWLKVSELAKNADIFAITSNETNSPEADELQIMLNSNNVIRLMGYTSAAYDFQLITTQLFRDVSAWYHIAVMLDTTQATASDRLKLYVNGEQVTDFSNETYPALNHEATANTTFPHKLGKLADYGTNHLDGYLAEVNFIDGQALTPDSFGETGDYGEWKPLKYTGAYGTNGFYLPFEQDYAVEGFSTVTYEGNGATQYIGGTGYQPDFTWIKERSSNSNNQLTDAVRGTTKILVSDLTNIEETETDKLTSFDSDGFSLGASGATNQAGITYVAWNWDMGGTTASNTNGSITSSVRANTTYGQSIVGYTGNGTAGATVGHGLASAPTMVIVKSRTVAGKHWATYHVDLGNTVRIDLESSGAKITGTGAWNSTTPTSSLVTLGSQSDVNTSSATHIMYAFHDVTGYSKFDSYEGTGGTHTITTGFAPAFVMIKNADASGSWTMWDNTRNPNNPVTQLLRANTDGVEETKTDREPSFLSTGFSIGDADADTNASGQTYIYMAFADTREYAYWLDQSGNNNDWTSEGGLTESDVMLDSPTNNFCTLNPLDEGGTNTVAEGNLQYDKTGANFGPMRGTLGVTTGKWYFEAMRSSNSNLCQVGVSNNYDISQNGGDNTMGNAGGIGAAWDSRGFYYRTGGSDGGKNTFATNEIVSVAFDADTGKIWWRKSGGSWQDSGNPETGANPSFTASGYSELMPFVNGEGGGGLVANFGQDSSFAGAKTPQANQDSNGIGDFYYAPPAGFLALCTQNLPEPTVIPSEHFNTVLYTGNGSTQAVTGVGFAPDFVWLKSRPATSGHNLTNTISGATKYLRSDLSAAEGTANIVTAFGSDGFTVGDGNGQDINKSGESVVTWNWKLGGSAVSNSNGSVTSQVSANVDAGISIATFTLPTTAQTIGHGLSKAPELVIHKGRVSGSAWWTFHKDIGNTSAVRLDGTNAAGASTNFWNNTSPTSTVVTIGANSGNNNSWLMYCFHSVDGYSKVGSYIGNGNHDGPFVYCGFKPAMVIFKNTIVADDWQIQDTTRSPFNGVNSRLTPNNTAAENTNSTWTSVDYLSNGFKQRYSDNIMNASGKTYIFIAFAENPFKHTNAR